MRKKITLTFKVDVIPPYDDYNFMLSDFKGELQCCVNMPTDQPKPQWQDAMMKNFLRRVEDAGT